MPPSLNMHLTHVNGHRMGICANTKLFVIMACTNLTLKNIMIIAARDMGLSTVC